MIANIARLREKLTPVLNQHAELFRIGGPTNRDRLMQSVLQELPSLLDEIEAFRSALDNYEWGELAWGELASDGVEGGTPESINGALAAMARVEAWRREQSK